MLQNVFYYGSIKKTDMNATDQNIFATQLSTFAGSRDETFATLPYGRPSVYIIQADVL